MLDFLKKGYRLIIRKKEEPSAPEVQLDEGQKATLRELFRTFPEFAQSQETANLLERLAVKMGTPNILEALKATRDEVNQAKQQTAIAYTIAYTQISDTRREIIKQVDKISNFYIVDVIINQLVEDALTPEIGTGEILDVRSDVPEIQAELTALDEKFNFDQIVKNVAPDLLKYGEYVLETEVVAGEKGSKVPTENLEKLHENRTESLVKLDIERLKEQNLKEAENDKTGLIDILDVVEQGTVVALTKDGLLDGYIVPKENNQGVDVKQPADYIIFSLDSQRVRIDINNEFSIKSDKVKDQLKKIPRFIRVGKSCIFPILSKIKELQLLEALVPATKISKLTSATMVGVQVPGGYGIKEGLAAAKKIEGLINKKIGIDTTLGEINIEDIISAAGRHKVLPIFGDKGSLQKMDFKSDEPDDLLSSIEDIRQVILSSAGIPFELIFRSDGESKGEILKRYARYLRKLKSIQRAMTEGAKQIAFIHLANKGIEFKADDVKIEFRNKLVEIDNLDKLEFIDTTIGMLDNLKNFVMELKDMDNPLSEKVDLDVLAKFLNEQLGIVGLGDLIKKGKIKKKEVDVDSDGTVEEPGGDNE